VRGQLESVLVWLISTLDELQTSTHGQLPAAAAAEQILRPKRSTAVRMRAPVTPEAPANGRCHHGRNGEGRHSGHR
jgi:hypothetical protein